MRRIALIVAILLVLSLAGCHWLEHIINGLPMTRQEKADLYSSQAQSGQQP